ncbi:MAG: hypothetical protein GY711_23950 [bacterium]|nr:hypothetical protein [bacterium]
MKNAPQPFRRPHSLFEQAFVAAAGSALRVCPACVGESTHRPWTICLEGDEPLPRCADCNGPVDHDGAAVGHVDENGVLSLKTIRLHAS